MKTTEESQPTPFNERRGKCQPRRWRARKSLGQVAAYLVSILLIAYAVTTILGFVSLESSNDQIEDPYFTLMEIFILLIMPLMLLAMVAYHEWAAPSKKMLSLSALGFMGVAVGITSSVHFVVWTVGRSITEQVGENADYLFSFQWPSVAYALDILAWDWFFALSFIFAAFVVNWTGKIQKTLRVLMLTSGILSLVGLIAIPLDNMQVRIIGIIGYAFFSIPIFCLLGVLLGQSKTTDEEEDPLFDVGKDDSTKEPCEQAVPLDEHTDES